MSESVTTRPTPVIRKEIAQVTAAIQNMHEQMSEQQKRRVKLYEELDAAMEEKYG